MTLSLGVFHGRLPPHFLSRRGKTLYYSLSRRPSTGVCAISSGMYSAHAEILNGEWVLLPVDLFTPGCPPHPLRILDGLVGRICEPSAGV